MICEIPPVTASPAGHPAGVVPMAMHVLGEARRDTKVLAAYLDDHPRAVRPAPGGDRRGRRPGRRWPTLWTDVIEPEFNRVSWMLSAATRSSGASFVTTRKRLQPLVGDAAANALTAGLGGQAGQLASLGLLDGLDQLASGVIDRDTFNRRYGHRGPHEFEISMPRPGEDPHWIDRQLAAAGRVRGPSYRELLANQERAREEAWAELESRHPRQARILHRQLGGLGQDHPRPGAGPQRGDPLLLGAAGVRAEGRRADRAGRRHLLPRRS